MIYSMQKIKYNKQNLQYFFLHTHILNIYMYTRNLVFIHFFFFFLLSTEISKGRVTNGYIDHRDGVRNLFAEYYYLCTKKKKPCPVFGTINTRFSFYSFYVCFGLKPRARISLCNSRKVSKIEAVLILK